MALNIGTFTDTQRTSTGNNVTLKADLRTQILGSTYTLYVDTDISWTRTGFDGSERLTITIYDASNAAQVATKTVTPTYARYSYTLTYSAPASNSLYAVVKLKWNDTTEPRFQTGAWSVAPVSFNSIAWSNIAATSARVNLTSDYFCDSFQWSLNNVSWNIIRDSNNNPITGTNASVNVTGLTAATANTVYFRGRRADLGNYGTTSSSVTTSGKAIITAVSAVEIDQNTPSVTITAEVYNTSYTYELTFGIGDEPIAMDLPITFSAIGTQTKTISLTNYKSAIFAEMPNTAETEMTYVLTTTIGGSGSSSQMDGKVYVTEANSAPTWLATPDVFIVDQQTTDFFGSNSIENGLINNATMIAAIAGFSPHGAKGNNGASIDHYYLSVGGVVKESNSDSIAMPSPISVSGNTIEIIYGAVDTRGFEASVTYTVPVYQYTPIYWSTTDIARQNGYDATIEFDVDATYNPLSVTVGGSTYTNSVSQSISGRYSTDNGTTWTSFTLTGTVGNTTITYNGTPLQPSDTPNTANVLIELTASDSLSSSTLSMTVPNGIPLIQIINGKVIINGDLQVNGTIINNP